MQNSLHKLRNEQSRIKKFISIIWPIEKHEIPKVLCMMGLMFCILFIQNIIRGLKDSIINTQIGTETISFLKSWAVLPASVLMTILYIRLVTIFKGVNIFYGTFVVFLSFFALFGFVLFPNQEVIHLSTIKTQELIQIYPHLKWFIMLLSNWSYSLFYVIAELWPTTVYALLYWQFINSITTVEESKRFYIIFGLLGQTGLLFSGYFLMNAPTWSQTLVDHYFTHSTRNTIWIQLSMGFVIVSGLIGIFLFYLLNNRYVSSDIINNIQFKAQKNHITLSQSIKFIFRSRYIALITTMLICYGACINLIEGPWKAKASQLYPSMEEYGAFVGKYLSYNGIVVLILVILGSNLVRSLGWISGAIITPLIMLVTGLAFFIINNFESVAQFLGGIVLVTDPLTLVVSIGIIQNVATKASKYSMLDSTKEMAYVPLDHETKTKGKAAADLVGSKLGKALSAMIQSLIFIVCPNATYTSTGIVMFLMIVFLSLCIIWIASVIQLNKLYTAISSE